MRVELRNIHKVFEDIRANDDISVVFEPGMIYGLLGENGAGKSTLMKILSGYQRPDSGKILLDGKPVRFNSPADALGAGIGMLYQEALGRYRKILKDNCILYSAVHLFDLVTYPKFTADNLDKIIFS